MMYSVKLLMVGVDYLKPCCSDVQLRMILEMLMMVVFVWCVSYWSAAVSNHTRLEMVN